MIHLTLGNKSRIRPLPLWPLLAPLCFVAVMYRASAAAVIVIYLPDLLYAKAATSPWRHTLNESGKRVGPKSGTLPPSFPLAADSIVSPLLLICSLILCWAAFLGGVSFAGVKVPIRIVIIMSWYQQKTCWRRERGGACHLAISNWVVLSPRSPGSYSLLGIYNVCVPIFSRIVFISFFALFFYFTSSMFCEGFTVCRTRS